jgi:HAD superfamily hydrolase (TIGR01509 family)
MKFPYTPAAVIFDMDGLLFDTEALYRRAYLKVANEKGYDLTPYIDLLVGRTWVKSRELLLETFGPQFPADDFMSSMVEDFKRLETTDLTVKPGAYELIDTLDNLRMPKAIATSSAHQTVQRHLKSHKLEGRFQEIVASGDYIDSKPAPDPFLRAAERLGIEPCKCIALEDSRNGVLSAATAKMMTIMVPDLYQPTDELKRLCLFVAKDLHEVREAVLSNSFG